jgi:CDP-diacylglycerol--glycerol-3-phosphate 3-phosphatidyltransferase
MANILTISRFMLIPVFLAFLFLGQFRSAFIVFAFAGITDLLDGMIARRFGQITELGKALDPLVDRLLIGSAFVGLAFLDIIPRWILLVVVARDLALILGYLVLRALRVSPPEVTLLGKASSTLLLLAIGLTLLLLAIGLNMLFRNFSFPLLYTSVGFSIVSGFDYFYKGTKALARR